MADRTFGQRVEDTLQSISTSGPAAALRQAVYGRDVVKTFQGERDPYTMKPVTPRSPAKDTRLAAPPATKSPAARSVTKGRR